MTSKSCSRGIRNFRIRSVFLREFFSEFLGTFVLCLFGNGVVAQVILSEGSKGNFFTINYGWGMSVTMGILVAGGASGGHINPAVTLALAVVDKFPWRKVLHYMFAQYLGAFLASGLVFATYYEALNDYEAKFNPNSTTYLTPGTAAIYATYPQEFLSQGGGLLDNSVSAFLLLLVICAVTDRRNLNISPGLAPFYVGMAVFNCGVCLGYNCGYALNPARDLAPRLFTMLAGWGTEPFTFGDHWWVVPVVATYVGGVIGAVVYSLFIGNHWDKEEEEDAGEDEGAKERMWE